MDGIITALAARTADLSTIAHLRAPDPSTSITNDPLFAALARELVALEKRVARLAAAVRGEHDALDAHASTTLTALAEQKVVLEHMLANVPRHLPRRRVAAVREVGKMGDGRVEVVVGARRAVQNAEDVAVVAPAAESADSVRTPPKRQNPIPRAVFIPPVTVAEFESLAKYQVGRLTRDKLNDTIAELATLVTDKQTQLRVPPSRMNKRQRELLWEHRKLEPAVIQATTDTSSSSSSSSVHSPPPVFVTEADVRDKAWFSRSAFRLDPHGRAVVGILRHLGRVKEVRGGGHTRIVIMS
ncbi:Spindle and kinetochore-associated protein 1 [Geranomyces michiganensis]|nr:Spindle and kinetochore-associated protein 1 [Geranomyces michiganensis]